MEEENFEKDDMVKQVYVYVTSLHNPAGQPREQKKSGLGESEEV